MGDKQHRAEIANPFVPPDRTGGAVAFVAKTGVASNSECWQPQPSSVRFNPESSSF